MYCSCCLQAEGRTVWLREFAFVVHFCDAHRGSHADLLPAARQLLQPSLGTASGKGAMQELKLGTQPRYPDWGCVNLRADTCPLTVIFSNKVIEICTCWGIQKEMEPESIYFDTYFFFHNMHFLFPYPFPLKIDFIFLESQSYRDRERWIFCICWFILQMAAVFRAGLV